MQFEGSRRQFVGGAVATGAVIGGMALFGRSGDAVSAAADRVAVVPGRSALAAVRLDPQEIDRWTAMVGQPVQIAGGRGTVESVLRVSSDDRRPAGVRQDPFSVTFLLDRATAPVGNAIYDIGHAVEGLHQLFLIRAADRGANAVFFAFFN